MSDGIDRPFNRVSGWCTQHGRPNCQGCKDVTCACPSDVCVAKRRRSEMAKQSGFGAEDRTLVPVESEAVSGPAERELPGPGRLVRSRR